MTPRSLCSRVTLEEVKKAVNRLSLAHNGSNPFLEHSPVQENSLTLEIRLLTTNLRRGGGSFRQASPLSPLEEDQLTSRNFEEDLWRSFKLTDPIVPDSLLKECKKALLLEQSNAGSTQFAEGDLRTALAILDTIHRSRKTSSILEKPVYPKSNWASLDQIAPHQFKKNMGSGIGGHFWALIIGNDAYPGAELKGCINDAKLVRDYLKEYLGVSSNHISTLKNATRQDIIDNLYKLRDNKDIRYGDILLIHFSGHGTTYDPATYFKTFVGQTGSIEAICPVDRGPTIPDISDRELYAIIDELRQIKGDNITLFLDCCHGGGVARSLSRSGPRSVVGVRYAEPLRTSQQTLVSDLEAMFTAADTNPLRSPNTPLTSYESWVPEMDGFVQLAGCHDFQIAKEGAFRVGLNSKLNPTSQPSQVHERAFLIADLGRGPIKHTVQGHKKPIMVGDIVEKHYGVFTWALIHVLKSNVGQTGTYEDIVRSIGRLSDRQDPVVVGRKDSRLWFRD